MAKKVPCTVVVNAAITGRTFPPKRCESMAEALRYARDMAMPYRIFVGKKCIKRGWIQ